VVEDASRPIVAWSCCIYFAFNSAALEPASDRSSAAVLA
jgi:hypothetical protein